MPDDIKGAVASVMTAFEEFKAANDQNLEKRDVLLEDKLTKINAHLDKYEDLNQELVQAQNAAKAAEDRVDELEIRLNRPGAIAGDPEDNRKLADTWARAVVNAHLMGEPNLSDDQRAALDEVKKCNASLSIGNDTTGGYLAPPEYVREIIKGVTEISPVRSLVRVRSTAMKSLILPKRNGQFAAQWVSEQGSRSETTGLSFGQHEIPTHELYALIDLSEQNLEDSAFDMEEFVREESSEQFALAEGTSVVTGDGVGKPEGFMTNDDIETTNSGDATKITSDGLIDLKHGVKTAYTANSHFVMNRTSLGSVRKLKQDGRYIWLPGLADGKPNTIDGDPYVEFPDMPNEGAGKKPVAYGDFRRGYTLVDRILMTMLRDPYTQATSGNIRFIFRRRLGGQVTLAEALRTLTCST